MRFERVGQIDRELQGGRSKTVGLVLSLLSFVILCLMVFKPTSLM